MKQKITSLLLITLLLIAPSFSFADEEPPKPSPSPSSSSVSTVSVGGGMVYCSGPMAPGWNVSLPNGGCSPLGGSVLGTSTTATSQNSSVCGPYLKDYMRMGLKNNPEQVRKLQTFLNKNLGLSIAVNGIFDQATFDAVEAFQKKYTTEILTPWGISTPTGYVYKTTLAQINALACM